MRNCYLYVIGWKKLNKYYIGIRYANGCEPKELLVSYFTSSKHVLKFIKDHDTPDIIDIRKTFGEDINACREYEHKILRRIGAVKSDKFLNKTDNISICIKAAKLGASNQRGAKRKWKPGSLEKISKANSLPWTEKERPGRMEASRLYGLSLLGVKKGPHSNESKYKCMCIICKCVISVVRLKSHYVFHHK